MIFEEFFKGYQLPFGTMDKSKFYKLIDFVDKTELSVEIKPMLTLLYQHLNG